MKVKIKVLNPVSITTGEDYFRDEYFIFGDYLYRVDLNRFRNSLDDSGIKELKKVITELTRRLESTSNITKENIDDYSNLFIKYINQSNELPDWIKYKIKIKSKEKLEFKQTNIREIIKNPITNKPIIPGSTIKGALRTILIKEYLRINEELKNKIKRKIKGLLNKIRISDKKGVERILKNVINDVENEIFCVINEEAKNESYIDIMRLVQVTDFTLENGSMSVRKAMRKKIRGGGKENQQLPIYLETIDEGSEFIGEIRIINHKCELKDTGILELLGEFSEESLKDYIKKISKIGFGKGFREQTILFEVFDTNNEEDENILKIIMKKLDIGRSPKERNYHPNPKVFPKTRIIDEQSNDWAEVKVEVV